MDQPAKNGVKDDTSPPAPCVTTITNVEISVHRESPTSPEPPEVTTSVLTTSVSTTIITTSCSSDTLNGETNAKQTLSGPSSPSNLSSHTLVGSTGSGSAANVNEKTLTPAEESQRLFKYSQAPSSPLPERKRKPAPEILESDKENKDVKVEVIKSPVERTVEIEIEPEPPKSISSKPTIVSAITKSGVKESEKPRTPMKTSSNVLQPMSYLSQTRRPSTGTINIPIAALTQHRHSLQMNSSEGGFGIQKVSERCLFVDSFNDLIFLLFFFSVSVRTWQPKQSASITNCIEKIQF